MFPPLIHLPLLWTPALFAITEYNASIRMWIYPEFINGFPMVLFTLDKALRKSNTPKKAKCGDIRNAGPLAYYLSELLNFGFDRWWSRAFHRGTIRCNSNRLHLLLELINLILYSPNSTPLPTQITSPQCVHKQARHHKWMNESKCSSLQNPKFPSNSKCILHSNNNTNQPLTHWPRYQGMGVRVCSLVVTGLMLETS